MPTVNSWPAAAPDAAAVPAAGAAAGAVASPLDAVDAAAGALVASTAAAGAVALLAGSVGVDAPHALITIGSNIATSIRNLRLIRPITLSFLSFTLLIERKYLFLPTELPGWHSEK